MSDREPTPAATGISQAIWESLRGARGDVSILMRFLIEANDGRLQAHFDDTRPSLAKPLARVATPPCSTYLEFLTRLSDIEISLDRRYPVALTQPDAAKKTMGDVTFLYWSRDFLATVAAPATADSIAITRHYVQARIRGGFLSAPGRLVSRWMKRLSGSGAN